MTDPRGIRNNNPGNIDRDATKWQGMADDQSSDPRFVVFKTPQWGIRAIARLMLTYSTAYHLNTVSGIIGRWAPNNENDTGAYVTAVAAEVGVQPDAVIDVDTTATMLPLVKAIIRHENGEVPYPDSLILQALSMAGVSDAKPAPLLAQKAFVTHAAGGVAVVASAAAQYAPSVKSAADQVADYTGIAFFGHVHAVLMGLAGALVLAGIVAEIAKHQAAQ